MLDFTHRILFSYVVLKRDFLRSQCHMGGFNFLVYED